jgi:putative sterol carrier protein
MGQAEEFFTSLDGRHDEPTLRHLSGTIRFDLERDDAKVDSWLVKLDDGDVAVSRKKAKADCVAIMSSGLFESSIRGEVNAIAAALRGDMEIEGQPALLLAFQRLFPGPPTNGLDRATTIGAGNE